VEASPRGPGGEGVRPALRRALPLFLLAALVPACGREAGSPPGPPSWDALFAPGGGRFLHVSSYDTTGGNRDRFEIASGDSAVLLDLEGPGVIRRIWITVASDDPHYLRRIALRMYWDGETEPSVAVPLGDFFGNGFEKTPYAALPMGVTSGGFYTYLPMPFRSRARIVAANGTGRVVDAFYFNASVELGAELPRPLATFHAWWNRDPRTTSPAPHRILGARGSGRLVGVSLNAESYSGSLWFLEGDEIFTVDGEFRGQGTGTEDYFNAGWYFEAGPFAAPYHGLVLKDEERGRIAAYRWHIPDPVPFRDSIRVELEHGHGNEVVADYATVAYWYQTEPHAPLPPLPPPDDRRVLDVKIPPGAVLADSLEVLEREGDRWRVRLPVPRPDRYELLVYPRIHEGADAGRPAPARVWDTVAVRGDSLTVLLTGEAADPAALFPRPLRVWAREWLVVGPFPNPQRVGTEYSPALDSVYGPEEDPDPVRTYLLADGRRAAWRPARAGPSGYVRLNPLFEPSDRVAAYAQTELCAPTSRQATLLLGADDAHVLWVNGERVSERQGRHIARADEIAVSVALRAGCNRILLKVADLDGGWGFLLRAADPAGVLRWRRPGVEAGRSGGSGRARYMQFASRAMAMSTSEPTMRVRVHDPASTPKSRRSGR